MSTNVTWINHHVHWSMDQIFYSKVAPNQQLDQPVRLGHAEANCRALPFPVTWNDTTDYPSGHPSIHQNAADKAMFEWSWYNDDNSLCSASKAIKGKSKKS